jgi:hypothetical protein
MFYMDEDATANCTKWRFVEVKGALKKIPRTDPRIEHGLTEKIEDEFSMWQKKIQKVRWKGGANGGKNSQEVVLERANSVFSLILAMHVRWDKLEFCVPLEVIASLYAALALLSKIWRSTKRPLAARHVIMAL